MLGAMDGCVTHNASATEDSMHGGSEPEFRWLERGEGEPVMLLHGLMGRTDHWEAALEHLGDQCRPMALSLPILPDVGRRFNVLIAESQVWFLARCGPVPMLERPVPFNRVVADWLEATRVERERPARRAGVAR
jgi:pimeloyl-ACP methyl ester carboxylesterase